MECKLPVCLASPGVEEKSNKMMPNKQFSWDGSEEYQCYEQKWQMKHPHTTVRNNTVTLCKGILKNILTSIRDRFYDLLWMRTYSRLHTNLIKSFIKCNSWKKKLYMMHTPLVQFCSPSKLTSILCANISDILWSS